MQHSKKCDICLVTLNTSTRENNIFLKAHYKVRNSGVQNYIGCRIPVNRRMNIEYMKSLLIDYKDKIVCDLLEYGFPIGFEGDRSNILQSVQKRIHGDIRIIKGLKNTQMKC